MTTNFEVFTAVMFQVEFFCVVISALQLRRPRLEIGITKLTG